MRQPAVARSASVGPASAASVASAGIFLSPTPIATSGAVIPITAGHTGVIRSTHGVIAIASCHAGIVTVTVTDGARIVFVTVPRIGSRRTNARGDVGHAVEPGIDGATRATVASDVVGIIAVFSAIHVAVTAQCIAVIAGLVAQLH